MSRRVALSQRGEIRLGFRCNARCGFCYYQDLLDNPKEKEPKTLELRSQLALLRASGATEVEFTGGEPTIRPDLPELARHARELGFTNVSLITNGLRLASKTYARQLVDSGINDFLLSIHGPDAAMHDQHTKVPGSFERITTAFRNVAALGARGRTSTTVTALNHERLDELLGLVIELGARVVHFAVFSPVAQAGGSEAAMAVRYSDAARSLRRALDAHANHLPLVSIKYIPFCVLRGYERHVMNLYQQSFDPDDWNYYFSNKVRRSKGRVSTWLFDAAVLAGGLLAKDHWVSRRHGLRGWKVLGLTRLVELIRKQRVPACRGCSYALVCDGVWKDYVKRFGEAEFRTVQGPVQRDPAWCYELAGSRAPGMPLETSARIAAS